MCLLHLAVTSGASGHLERPLSCAYTRAVTHIQLRPPPPPRGPSKDARSQDVLRTSSNGSLIPSYSSCTCGFLLPRRVSDTRRLLPLSQKRPPVVATCSCAPTSKRCSRIQKSSPHRVWPLHVQVCAPFTYGQFSKVSPIFICGPHLPRCTARPSCGPLLPRPAIILPQIGVLALDVARRR